ncbi:MAG: nitrite/sulfite reductase, partial [Nitrososphaerales archaeon]
MTEIKPNLRTPPDDLSGTEKAKVATNGLRTVVRDIQSPTNLSYQLRDTTAQDVAEVAEMLEKSYGIYLEYNRALTGDEYDWMYMLRITLPGGGPITRKQWQILDDVAERYTETENYTGKKLPSLRLTTRQNIQLHWVRKKNLVDSVKEIAASGFYTINGCGDNVRNTMGCPLGYFSKVFDSNEWAQKVGKFFRLPTAAYMEIFAIDPKYLREEGEKDHAMGERCDSPVGQFDYGNNLLNRKFKIAFSGIIYDKSTKTYRSENCVEMRTNDIGVAPILENGKVSRMQVYIGGSQGEKAGFPTFSASGSPFGIFGESTLLKGLEAIVRVHKEWGDRQNRNWARLKYDIYKKGMDWYRDQVREVSSVDFEPPIQDLDYGPRELHQGWMKQESREGVWNYGAFIENGRLTDSSPNGNLKTMVRYLMDNYDVILLVTPNQDLIFGNIEEGLKDKFEGDLLKHGFGKRNGAEYS